jgi:hypothetical protein
MIRVPPAADTTPDRRISPAPNSDCTNIIAG